MSTTTHETARGGDVCPESAEIPGASGVTTFTNGSTTEPRIVLGPITSAHSTIAIAGELVVGEFLNRVDNTFRSLRGLFRVQYLEVDLSGIAAIDKTGARVMQRSIKAARDCGARVELTNVPVEIEFVLAAAGIPIRKAEGGGRP